MPAKTLEAGGIIRWWKFPDYSPEQAFGNTLLWRFVQMDRFEPGCCLCVSTLCINRDGKMIFIRLNAA